MTEKVETKLAEVESEMKDGEAAVASKPKKVTKMAKKAPKKVKKAAKANGKSNGKHESAEGKVSLADLASEAQITTAAARRKLRAADMSREGRWSWDDGSKGLKEARKALGLE